MVRRNHFCERIGCIEAVVVALRQKLPVQFIRAWLGQNFDASVTQLVELRREGILIDANLANGGLRRKLPARKSINVNLSAVGSRRRTRQRL